MDEDFKPGCCRRRRYFHQRNIHINPEKKTAYNFFRRNEFRSARHLNGPNLLSATRKHTNTKLHINHLSFQKLQRLDSIAKQKVVRSWYFHGQLKKQLFKKDERNVSILTIVPFFCVALPLLNPSEGSLISVYILNV